MFLQMKNIKSQSTKIVSPPLNSTYLTKKACVHIPLFIIDCGVSKKNYN